MGLFSAIGSVVGGVGGFFLGGPVGAGIGAGAGASLGGIFDKPKNGGGGGGGGGGFGSSPFLDIILRSLREQQDILGQMREEGNILLPALFQALGIEGEFENGRLVGADGGISQELLGLERGRLRAALSGEDVVDPALERALAKSGGVLEEALRRQLGPGFETSTAGIQSLQEQRAIDEILRFKVREETIRGGTERELRRTGALGGALAGLPGRQAGLLQGLRGLGGAAQGPLSFLLGQMGIGAERDIFQKRLKESRLGGLGSILGTVATTPFGGGIIDPKTQQSSVPTSLLQRILQGIVT